MSKAPMRIRLIWWLFRSPFTEFLRQEALEIYRRASR